MTVSSMATWWSLSSSSADLSDAGSTYVWRAAGLLIDSRVACSCAGRIADTTKGLLAAAAYLQVHVGQSHRKRALIQMRQRQQDGLQLRRARHRRRHPRRHVPAHSTRAHGAKPPAGLRRPRRRRRRPGTWQCANLWARVCELVRAYTRIPAGFDNFS